MTSIHVLAGLLALAAGAVALCAAKGRALHRSSGLVFVYFVWTMSATGTALAAAKGDPLSVLAGTLSFYLVTTALLTVRRSKERHNVVGWAAAMVAFIVAAASFKCGSIALQSPLGKLAGYPSTPYFIFGSVALVGASLDLRNLLSTTVSGKHRLARHLWRMGFAMFIATSSFFLGQAKVFPEPVRNLALLSIPVVFVVLSTMYWLVRVLGSTSSGAYPGRL